MPALKRAQASAPPVAGVAVPGRRFVFPLPPFQIGLGFPGLFQSFGIGRGLLQLLGVDFLGAFLLFRGWLAFGVFRPLKGALQVALRRSEEHTSELQSPMYLV